MNTPKKRTKPVKEGDDWKASMEDAVDEAEEWTDNQARQLADREHTWAYVAACVLGSFALGFLAGASIL